jgi:hypothetical protein
MKKDVKYMKEIFKIEASNLQLAPVRYQSGDPARVRRREATLMEHLEPGTPDSGLKLHEPREKGPS